MRRLRPIDMHAHIQADIAAADLMELGSLVFAATRSLDEASQVLSRSEPWTIWGVGCHPGLTGAQKAFDHDRFANLIQRTSYVSEVGLDGKSRVPMHTQLATFNAILDIVQANPRIVSIHSYAATEQVLGCLTARPIRGAVLHWWLGDADQTRRAVGLGCYFSINASMLQRPELFDRLPLDRLLPETDHPFGDRAAGKGRRPGLTEDVELAIARGHGIDSDVVRSHMWRNLSGLVDTTHTGSQMPRQARVELAALT